MKREEDNMTTVLIFHWIYYWFCLNISKSISNRSSLMCFQEARGIILILYNLTFTHVYTLIYTLVFSVLYLHIKYKWKG